LDQLIDGRAALADAGDQLAREIPHLARSVEVGPEQTQPVAPVALGRHVELIEGLQRQLAAFPPGPHRLRRPAPRAEAGPSRASSRRLRTPCCRPPPPPAPAPAPWCRS